MKTRAVALFGVLCAAVWPLWAAAQTRVQAPVQAPAEAPAHARYDLFAAGIHVADVAMAFDQDAAGYRMALGYHTTGLASLFSNGRNHLTVSGRWRGTRPLPHILSGHGSWRGDPRLVRIDYDSGAPVIEQLLPADTAQRLPVPPAMTVGAVDSLSALSALVHSVAAGGTCDMALRTFDGHRLIAFVSHTAGIEPLRARPTSPFNGPALRCDFTGTPIAGMKPGSAADARPLRGTVWIGRPVPGAPPLPVRMAFQTRWFGAAMMYLTTAGLDRGTVVARTD